MIPPHQIFHESLCSFQYFIVLIQNCKSAELQHKCLLTVARETISSRVWRKLRTWEYHHTHKSTSRELNLAKQTPVYPDWTDNDARVDSVPRLSSVWLHCGL